MKHLVVSWTEKLPGADGGFIARHGSGDELASGGASFLGGCKHGRKDNRGRMEYRAVVDVILLDDMRGGAVH